MYRTITWVSDTGMTVNMGAEPPYIFNYLTDRLGGNAETSRAPRQDGQTTHFVSLTPRTINIIGSLVAYGDKQNRAQAVLDRQKSELCRAFAPHRFGTLIYHRANGDVQIRCRPLSIPAFGERANNTCTVDIELESDVSMWETSEMYMQVIGEQQKLWRFPFAFAPLVFGTFAPVGFINNPTTEIIYPEVEIASTAQTVKVENVTTGMFIALNRPIEEHQKMVIQTEDASAAIWERNEAGEWVNIENVSHWLTLDSDPWGLVPGNNEIRVSNEIPEETPVTQLRYRVPVMGV